MTTGRASDVAVRPRVASDTARLYAINEGAVPGVGSVSADAFSRLLESADSVLVACRDGAPIGFVLCMLEGLDYASLNYVWLSARYDRFAYVDRIAVAEEARGSGAGAQLYAAAIDRYAGRRPVLLAEVNLAPPNPGSLRFHERLGFRPVGERWSDGREKGVVYLERPLAG